MRTCKVTAIRYPFYDKTVADITTHDMTAWTKACGIAKQQSLAYPGTTFIVWDTRHDIIGNYNPTTFKAGHQVGDIGDGLTMLRVVAPKCTA